MKMTLKCRQRLAAGLKSRRCLAFAINLEYNFNYKIV